MSVKPDSDSRNVRLRLDLSGLDAPAILARMQAKSLILLFLVTAQLGCGQTGPLYLPDRSADPSGQRVEQPETVPSNPSPESQRDRKTKPGTEDVPATDTQTPAPLPDPSAPSPTPPGN